MTQKIVQINFKITTPVKDYATMVAPMADSIGRTPGLEWKVWHFNEQNHEAGGVYLFSDEASANAYLAGDIVATMKKQTTIKDISVKISDLDENLSSHTRAPIKSAITA